MTRQSFPGGWYCDALARSGAYAVLIRDAYIASPDGRIPLPAGQNLLFVRVADNDGELQVAGIGHHDDQAWEYDGATERWEHRGPAFGPNAVAYDAAGKLLVITGPPAVGYRYVAEDGRIVTAEETYADPARQMWEYTTLGNLTIGQGGDKLGHGDDPVIALLDGQRYLIQPGRCRFIRFSRFGNQLALAWVQENTNSAELLWLTLDELKSFPRVAVVATPDPVTPTPDPEPVPVPSPPPNLLSLIESRWAVRDMESRQESAYAAGGKGAIQRLQAHWLLDTVPHVQHALPPGWRVRLEKYRNPVPGTDWFFLPDQYLLEAPDGIVWSAKVIRGKGEAWHRKRGIDNWTFGSPAWDGIGNAEGTYTVPDPLLDPATANIGPAPWDAQPAPTPQPTPTPTPTPQPAPVCHCTAELAALTQRIADLERADADKHEDIVRLMRYIEAIRVELESVAKVGYQVRTPLKFTSVLTGTIVKS